MPRQAKRTPDRDEILDRCLKAFIHAGTLDLSLDQLGARVGTSKRMLVHYFGGREKIEHGAIARLERRLRAQFAPGAFPPGTTPDRVLAALWERTTDPGSRNVLLLIMDVSRRAWSGSARAKRFYKEQRRLWIQLLLQFIPGQADAEKTLQLFQGAVMTYLVTGDRNVGRLALQQAASTGPKTATKTGRALE